MKKLNNIFLALFIIGFTISATAQCVDCSGTPPTGTTASVVGIDNIASGIASFAGGKESEAIGKQSFAFGDYARAMSPYSIALGNYVMAFGGSSVALGGFARTTISSSMVIGYGFDSDNYLQNSEHNSILFGFNSDKPTFFIGGSAGLGYTGKIGIGDVTDPHAKLHIKADNGENAGLLLEPGGSSNFAKIKFGEISLNNSPNRIEAKQAGDLDFYTASDYVFRNGNVGIGLTNPLEKLEVDGNIKQSPGFQIFSDKIKAAGTDGLTLHDETGNGIVVKSWGKVGIGTGNASLSSELEVDGTIFTKHFRMDNSIPGNSDPLIGFDGYVLQSDQVGNASWVDPMTLNVDDGDWGISGNDIYSLNGGNVGIGLTDPDQKLELANGGIQLNGEYGIGFNGEIPYDGNAGEDKAKIYYDDDFGGSYKDYLVIEKTDNDIATDGGIAFTTKGSDNVRDILMILKGSGNVGIGTQNPEVMLEVAGNIKATSIEVVSMEVEEMEVAELKVTTKIEAGEIEVKDMKKWEDEVFEESYDLATLSEVEEFIKENGHLPEIPSEAEVLDKGYNMGEMDAMLLKKIEELTLYVIEQQKEIDELKRKD